MFTVFIPPLVYCSQSFVSAADRQPESWPLVRVFSSLGLLRLSSCLLLLPPPPQEEDFQEMVRTGQTMEIQYSHLFDKVIVNDDLSTAFGELRLALRKVEVDTQWVPVSWTHS